MPRSDSTGPHGESFCIEGNDVTDNHNIITLGKCNLTGLQYLGLGSEPLKGASSNLRMSRS